MEDGKSPRGGQGSIQEAYKEAIRLEKMAVKGMVQEICGKALLQRATSPRDESSQNAMKGGKSKFLNSQMHGKDGANRAGNMLIKKPGQQDPSQTLSYFNKGAGTSI